MPFNRKLYPDNWEEISERIRFTRAKGKCECDGMCGGHDGHCTAEHGQTHPVTGSMVVLTTAHWPDHDPMNCDDDNLFALCQKCHNTLDMPMRQRNVARKRKQALITAGQMVLI